MRGLMLDRRGQVEGESTIERAKARGPSQAAQTRQLVEERLQSATSAKDRAFLETIRENLDKGHRYSGPFAPRGSPFQGWEEVLRVTIADGTAITAAAETILVPDFTIPADYLEPKSVLKYTLAGKWSTVITTPGTATLRLRWGGVAGVVLAASDAYAPDPTAAQTDGTWWVEYYMVCRSIGATGTALTWGKMKLGDHDNASATTLADNIDDEVIPRVSLAAVTIDTTTAKALSPTWQPSVATGSVTCMYACLESLN